ncbi:hypothetical protein M0805_003809 [Coniferiporia weirii]|nr:hypothetical protein M0805_003809 [Coniferiporia weirii]
MSLPEEILEHIFSLVFSSSFADETCASPGSAQSPLCLLLACKSFERIAKPLLYGALHLRSRGQADKLACALTAQPALSLHIRAIRVDGPSAGRAFHTTVQLMSAFQLPRPLELLDVRIADERTGSDIATSGEDLERLCTALTQCPDVRHLVLRQGVYMKCRVMTVFVHALASAVPRWPSLETVDFRYKPTPLPPPIGQPPRDPLAAALASAPQLRIVRAHRPTLLNAFLPDIAENPTLERIELLDGAELPHAPPLAAPRARRWSADESGTGAPCTCNGDDNDAAAAKTTAAELATVPKTLFASEMKAYPRLDALVRAGRVHLVVQRLRQRQRRHSDLVVYAAGFEKERAVRAGFEPGKVCSACLGICARSASM